MKMEDVEVGMKVVPVGNNSTGSDVRYVKSFPSESSRMLRERGYMYVCSIHSTSVLIGSISPRSTWSYHPSNFELYIEPKLTTKKEITQMKIEAKRVTFNNPATIVHWDDDTKTIVKTSENDVFDARNGFLHAYFEKHSGLSKTQCGKALDKIEADYNEQMVKLAKKQERRNAK